MSRAGLLACVVLAVWAALVLVGGGVVPDARADVVPAALAMRWGIDEQRVDRDGRPAGARAHLVLRNTGDHQLAATGWALYFNSADAVSVGEATDGVAIEAVTGGLYRLMPREGFLPLRPGESRRLTLDYAEPALKDNRAPLGPYLVFDAERRVGHPITDYVLEPRVRPEQLTADARQVAEARYDRAWSVSVPTREPVVLPTPRASSIGDGRLSWSRRPPLVASAALAPERAAVEALLARYPALRGPADASVPSIRLRVDRRLGPSPEAYRLTSDPNRGLVIAGATPAGVARGVATLDFLLPVDATEDPSGAVSLAALTIEDAPRYPYRGLLVDVARNFQPPAVIERLLDLMARYKLNVLHLHLTDDEGWRLAIAGLAELTDVGARRGHSDDPDAMLPPAHGSGPDPADPHGSGFYTADEYVAILRHAAARRIEVVPEIEMPGHARAAVRAMTARYHRLGGRGHAAAEAHLLQDPADTSRYTSAQGYTDNVMDPGLPSTYRFVDRVLGELARLHREAGVPLRTVHVGADEVPSGAWRGSPAARHLAQRLKLEAGPALWGHYYRRVAAIAHRHGAAIAGWEELGAQRVRSASGSRLEPDASLLGLHPRLHVWNNLEGSEDLGVRLANAGYSVVLEPVSAYYLDMAYDASAEEPGATWAPPLSERAVFDFLPTDPARAVATDPQPVAGRARLTARGADHVEGLEAALWSEGMRSPERIEYLAMPRLLGLAERGWAEEPAWARAPDAGSSRRAHATAWSAYLKTVVTRALPRLARDLPDVNYRVPPPGARLRGDRVEVTHEWPGISLRYTTDGTPPTTHSAIVDGALPATPGLRITAFDVAGRASRPIAPGD
jgi:hexosaminidase